MNSIILKVTKVGLKALSKSPGDRTALERRQARKAELALKQKKQIEKQAQVDAAKAIQDALKPYSKAAAKFTGIKKLAYRVKLFWLVEKSRPKRFHPVSRAIDLDKYELLKQATIELADKCIDDYQYSERAIAVWTLLDKPPLRARRINIAATCRVFADFVLDNER